MCLEVFRPDEHIDHVGEGKDGNGEKQQHGKLNFVEPIDGFEEQRKAAEAGKQQKGSEHSNRFFVLKIR